jgi:hypothetical protein
MFVSIIGLFHVPYALYYQVPNVKSSLQGLNQVTLVAAQIFPKNSRSSKFQIYQ